MPHSLTIKLIAACAMLHWATASFSDENHVRNPVGSNAMNVEQKDWGIAGEAQAVQRTLTIRMSDNMRFTPAHLEVKQGETVRLIVNNSGKLLHELVIGSPQALAEHAEQMLKFPTMEHGSPDMAHVAARKTGEIVWHFNRAGDFAFACLIPGHYQAGMTGTIRVSAPSGDMTDGEVRFRAEQIKGAFVVMSIEKITP